MGTQAAYYSRRGTQKPAYQTQNSDGYDQVTNGQNKYLCFQ